MVSPEHRKYQKRLWQQQHADDVNAYHRAYYYNVIKPNKEAMKRRNESMAHSRRKRKYGIDREAFKRMLTEQDGKCIICNEWHGEALRVDHDHATGAVRGLLCNNCNAGLGQFKDDQERLRNAIEYLEHSKAQQE